MKPGKPPRRNERRKAREQKRGKSNYWGLFDNFSGRDSNLNDFKTHRE